MFDLIVDNARLYPMAGDAGLATDRAFAVKNGHIVALARNSAELGGEAKFRIDAGDRMVLPGFIDCHTHAVFAGHRMAEQVMRLQGKTYEQIARAGGGIANTVNAVRAASESELLSASEKRLKALMAEGVTGIEIKSGYGLDVQTELKMLRVIKQLNGRLAVDISATFLGAHTTPKGTEKSAYLTEVIDVMLPQIAAENLASNVDIYVESIAFDIDDLNCLAAAAKTHSLGLRVHADQLSNMGATRRAAMLGALSCDHLEYSEQEDVQAMADNGTVAVLLPGAFYFLGETRKPPVRQFRDARVAMAVASDLNPGTSPVASLLTCMHFACSLFGLTAEEALLGVTLHAARAMGRERDTGSLEPGKMANFCIWDLPAPEYFCYQLGGLAPDAIYFEGQTR